MPYLVAQGSNPQERWRRALTPGEAVILGRENADWSISWDPQISRRHARIELIKNRLKVEQLAGATNPVFYAGKSLESFVLSVGEHFVIGNTKFSLVPDQVMFAGDFPRPDAEQTFNPEYLKKIEFRDADQRITLLTQLPAVISRATQDSDLYVHLINLLMSGIRRATTVALVRVPNGEAADIEVLHWDRRVVTETAFQPSHRLIRKATKTRETVLHVWKSTDHAVAGDATLVHHNQWAFATPLPGSVSAGWAIYVSGYQSTPGTGQSFDPQDLRDDFKFTELIASTLANLRQVKTLERRQAGLRSFFSPIVLDLLSDQDPELALAPRECPVSVLFCDLRGFSLTSEQYSDNLLELLDQVSRALGIATREILSEGGVVGDFHGDSTMGFWGWPLDQTDSAVRACRASLKIRKQFEQLPMRADPKSDFSQKFRIGIGIATGTAVAGKIGTTDQVKVSVFGPVVNLASRLESMTQHFRTDILVDEETARQIRPQCGGDEMRVRRLAKVQPFGLAKTLMVSQILPPAGAGSLLEDEHIQAYESALDDFVSGDWESAFEKLHKVPAEDYAKDFLTVYIAQHNRVAPPDWAGFIRIQKK